MNNSLHEQTESFDKLKEECGVFGIYDFDGNNVASTIYYGLFALQHRGQESCGIAVSDTNGPKGQVRSYKGMGLVNEVFDEESLSSMYGDIGVGHVRYSTAGASSRHSRWYLIISREPWPLPITETLSMPMNCGKNWHMEEPSSRPL